MKDQTSRRLFVRELGGSLAFYAIVLAAANVLARGMAPGAARTLVLLTPMLPFLATLWVTVRAVRRSDEFIRKTTLEHVAIAAAVTAGVTFTYGFLEIAGFPRISMFAVWPLMGGVWALLGVVHALRHR